MNKTKIAILSSILMLSLSFLFSSSFASEPELGEGRISLVQGQVFVQAMDEGEWTEAVVNFPIADGDRILTEQDGRTELQFQDGTYVRVGEESQLDIVCLGFDQGKAFFHFNQMEGKIYVNYRPISGEASSLYVDLPYGVLSSYVPSRFRVYFTTSEARISVLEGSVEFKRDGRTIPIVQGRTLVASEGGSAQVAQFYGRDEWDRWNEARDDELLQRTYAQKYLPPELEPYGYEMERNGRWVYTPEYQYVWVPTVAVGWTPFQYGYWAWRRGVYCWVPREPWGWVPFHYGRWVHTHNHGWAWVPPVRHATIWNPGAVAWNIAPTHVSWVPLAPGEIYYGNRYYGPQSENINQVKINIQENVYINARVKDAVVTVHRDSFFRRNPVRITKVENPFLQPAKVSGPPTEKPVFLEGKKTPPRFMRESVGKVQPERKPLSKELGRDIPSVERDPKVIEQKRITESPGKRTISETARNRVERIERPNRQTDTTQEKLVKRESTPVLTRERARGESQTPNPEVNKNRNTPIVPPVIIKLPNAKEPKYSQAISERNASRIMNQDQSGRIEQSNSNKENLAQRNLISLPLKDETRVKSPNPVAQSPQRNTSVSVNQNRAGRTGQPNSLQSLPPRQEGRAFAGRSSLPEGRSSPAPASKGQVKQNSHGSVGGLLGSSPLKSFR
ncbi:MAG: FecR family protein [Thermodesulfobacteriota bacterium]|jgi:hypothetical protein